jgi:hypothetical protein
MITSLRSTRRWDGLAEVHTSDAALESDGRNYRKPGLDGQYEGRA